MLEAQAAVKDLGARLWRAPFARFLTVGAGNTAVGYGIFYLLLRAGLAPTFALALATIVGVVFNFFTTGRVVFANADIARLWRFGFVYAAVFAINAALLEAVIALGLSAAAGQALLLAPCVALSYFLNRTLVFNVAREV